MDRNKEIRDYIDIYSSYIPTNAEQTKRGVGNTDDIIITVTGSDSIATTAQGIIESIDSGDTIIGTDSTNGRMLKAPVTATETAASDKLKNEGYRYMAIDYKGVVAYEDEPKLSGNRYSYQSGRMKDVTDDTGLKYNGTPELLSISGGEPVNKTYAAAPDDLVYGVYSWDGEKYVWEPDN